MHVVAGQDCPGRAPALRAAVVDHRALGYDVDTHRVQRRVARLLTAGLGGADHPGTSGEAGNRDIALRCQSLTDVP